MDKLNPIIFVTPFIALSLLVFLYFILSKKTANKTLFRQYVVIIFALAFILNFTWEVLQMPLYTGGTFNMEHVAFCALASVADAIMVTLLYLIFALCYNDSFWIQEIVPERYFLLIIIGGIGAIVAEKIHTAVGNWSYNSNMPIIPFVSVGLLPVLQFLLLPICIYFFGIRILNFYTFKR